MPVEGARPESLPDDVLGAGWLGAGWLGAGRLGAGWLGAGWLGAGRLGAGLTVPPPRLATYVGGVGRATGTGAAIWLGRAT